MSVRIIIEGYLKHYTNDVGLVLVEGNSISSCLEDLVRRYPGFKERLFDKNGNLRLIINYNGKFINLRNDLNKTLKDGEKFHILPVIGGG